jgi:hypothetical protein
MYCCTRAFRSFFLKKSEPDRDVSFITNVRERKILTDAIVTVNSIEGGWDMLRRGENTMISHYLNSDLHTEDSLYSTLQILEHITDNWSSWVEKRTERQNTDATNRLYINSWIQTHQYTEKTNNFILFSYLDHFLRYNIDMSPIDMQGCGATDLIFAIECVIAKVNIKESELFKEYSEEVDNGSEEEYQKTDAYKVEVYNKIVNINIPSDYELSKELMDRHKEFISTFNEKRDELYATYKNQITELRAAIVKGELVPLQNAMRNPSNQNKIRNSLEYLVAIGIEEELLSNKI